MAICVWVKNAPGLPVKATREPSSRCGGFRQIRRGFDNKFNLLSRNGFVLLCKLCPVAFKRWNLVRAAACFRYSNNCFLCVHVWIQVQTMTMLENLREARGPGSALNLSSPRTCAAPAARLCGSQTANSSGCSFSKDCSASASLRRDPELAVEETGRVLLSPP